MLSAHEPLSYYSNEREWREPRHITSVRFVNDPCCYKFLMTSLVFNHHREMPRATETLKNWLSSELVGLLQSVIYDVHS